MNEGTPDTLPYLILGLVVTFGILAAFIGSLVARYRNLQKDVELLEQLGNDK
jgi:hypothetical protein